MTSTLKKYGTLAEALKDYTNASNPEKDATDIQDFLIKEFPGATHVVLFANKDMTSPEFGSYIVYSVGLRCAFERIEDFEGGILIEAGPKNRFPVAYVEINR